MRSRAGSIAESIKIFTLPVHRHPSNLQTVVEIEKISRREYVKNTVSSALVEKVADTDIIFVRQAAGRPALM